MNVAEAVKSRRTVRGFKSDPVPQQVIREILEIARFSASNCNTQPWHLSVISGAARQRLEKELVALVTSGAAPAPAFTPGDANLSGVYKQRQYDCAISYYGTMGIAREDKAKRNQLALKNWQFFGAPHVGILSMPKSMGPCNALDLGIFLQSFMLLLVEYGLASCAQGALAMFPEPILRIADIPADNGIICGISFGYEDPHAKINEVRMDRDPLESIVNFIE